MRRAAGRAGADVHHGIGPQEPSVAFSVAGIPSDAFESAKPGARFLFGDSGKRYAFEIRNGVVFAKSPGLPDVALTTTVSYNHKRKRLAETTTMPPVDLIASNGGRVFAKAKDRNSFYFTTMRAAKTWSATSRAVSAGTLRSSVSHCSAS